MGEFRDYRAIIPGAIFLISLAILLHPITNWDFSDILTKLSSNLDFIALTLTSIIALFVSSFVGGLVFGNITSLLAPCFGFFERKGIIKATKRARSLTDLYLRNHYQLLRNLSYNHYHGPEKESLLNKFDNEKNLLEMLNDRKKHDDFLQKASKDKGLYDSIIAESDTPPAFACTERLH